MSRLLRSTKLGLALKDRIGRCCGKFVIEPGRPNGKKGRLYKLIQKDLEGPPADSKTSSELTDEGPLSISFENPDPCVVEGDLGDLIEPYSSLEASNFSEVNLDDGDCNAKRPVQEVPGVRGQDLSACNNKRFSPGTCEKTQVPEGAASSTKIDRDSYGRI
jgi:hypothetical protein